MAKPEETIDHVNFVSGRDDVATAALREIIDALNRLDNAARQRVVGAVRAFFDLDDTIR